MGTVHRLVRQTAHTLGTGNSALLPSFPELVTEGLNCAELARVSASRPGTVTLDAGESLYFQGDSNRNIYLLLDGWAFRHQILEDGRRQILDFSMNGAVLGLPGSGVLLHGLETLTPCMFTVLTRERILELVRDVPAFGLRLLEISANAESRAFEHLTSVGRRTAIERVAFLLLELVRRLQDMNAPVTDTTWPLPLMLPHIADALGLTSETVCRVLSTLRRNKVLSLRGQRLEVIDERRLSALAGGTELRERPRTGIPFRAAASASSCFQAATPH